MPTLDDLRTQGEAELEQILTKLDRRHRARVQAAIEQYGRVQDIPESFWKELQFEIENEQVAAIMLLILAGDEWTTDSLERQGVQRVGRADQRGAALDAARQVQRTAAQTVDTLRGRLERKIEDAKASGPGDVGELTEEGIEEALDDVFTDERRQTIATDETTIALTKGQRAAGARGDGASTEAGQQVTIELIWSTELDRIVCPRCSPLEGTNEEVWGKVFPDGPGPEAHPNCRCSLLPRIIVQSPVTESTDDSEGRWITIRGNAVKISDDGEILTGPMKGEKLGGDKPSPKDDGEKQNRSKRVLDEVIEKASSIKHKRVKDASSADFNAREWARDSMGQAAYGFRTSNGAGYEVLVTRDETFQGIDVKTDYVQFLDEKQNYKVTGAGKAHEVFSNVVPAVVSYVKEAKPPVMTFTATEPSRQRLYDRLVRATSAALPEYKAYSQDDKSGRSYIVVHRSARSKFAAAIKNELVAVESIQHSEWIPIEPEIDPDWFEPEGWEDEEDEDES